MRKFDETCKESLSTAELSEMLVDYAQINERLEEENKRLRSKTELLSLIDMLKPTFALRLAPDGSLVIKVVGKPQLRALSSDDAYE